MSTQIQPALSSQVTYYVMNMKNEHWIKISDTYSDLDEAKKAYSNLIKRHPFARLGGRNNFIVEK